MNINIMIISKSSSSTEKIKSMIVDEEINVTGDSYTGAAALDRIESLSPDMIIMTLGIADTDTLSLAERVILHRPRTHVILLVEHLDLDILKSAIDIGAHNVIEYPSNSKEFCDYIKSVYHNENTRLNSLKERQNLSWMSRVITVFGAKGGIGKTSIAVNLAIKLAESHKKVALVDLDLQFGDVHIFLDINPRDTITELVQESIGGDIDSVRSFMTIHSSGVHTICCPRSPEYAETIPAEKVRNLLSLLRSYYDYVVIDTQPFFDDVTITALESSSSIIFVAGLDISIVKNSKLALTLLDSLQLRDKVLLAVNKVGEGSSITPKDLEKTLGVTVEFKLPSDYKTAVSALNRGVPFVQSSPSCKLSLGIQEIASKLLLGNGAVEEEQKNSKGKFRFSK